MPNMNVGHKRYLGEHDQDLLVLCAQQPDTKLSLRMTGVVIALHQRVAELEAAAEGPDNDGTIIQYDDGSKLCWSSMAGGGHPEAKRWAPLPAMVELVFEGADGGECALRYQPYDVGVGEEIPQGGALATELTAEDTEDAPAPVNDGVSDLED